MIKWKLSKDEVDILVSLSGLERLTEYEMPVVWVPKFTHSQVFCPDTDLFHASLVLRNNTWSYMICDVPRISSSQQYPICVIRKNGHSFLGRPPNSKDYWGSEETLEKSICRAVLNLYKDIPGGYYKKDEKSS